MGLLNLFLEEIGFLWKNPEKMKHAKDKRNVAKTMNQCCIVIYISYISINFVFASFSEYRFFQFLLEETVPSSWKNPGLKLWKEEGKQRGRELVGEVGRRESERESYNFSKRKRQTPCLTPDCLHVPDYYTASDTAPRVCSWPRQSC